MNLRLHARWNRLVALGALAPLTACVTATRHDTLSPLSALSADDRTAVLVLGTPHVGTLGARFKRDAFANLIHVLNAFRPTAIVVERMAAAESDALRSLAPRATFSDYVRADSISAVVRAALGVNLAAVDSQIAQLSRSSERPRSVREWDQRAALFLAKRDLPSAVLQWASRGDTVSESAVLPPVAASYLERLRLSRNEIYVLGVELARRLGHTQLYSVDDLSDEGLLQQTTTAQALEAEISRFSSGYDKAYYDSLQSRFVSSVERGDVLPVYREFNSPQFERNDVEKQWNFFLGNPMRGDVGHTRIALWEMRNLRIAANIARVASSFPRGRILVIYGASHRSFVEQYLRASLQMRVVDFADVLRTASGGH